MGRSPRRRPQTKRTNVYVDLTELAEAKKTLGTQTTSDTINGALRHVNRRTRLATAAALIADGDLDAISPDDLDALRRVEPRASTS